MKRLLLLAAAAMLSGCDLGTTTEVASNPSDPATETFAANLVTLGVNIPTMTKTQHGVYYKDLIVGTGALLSGTPTVVFSYAGFLKNGSVFDSGNQITFPLSSGVFGIQEGMQGMKVGGERLIVIPSLLGYDNTLGLPVPPNSTIIFDIGLSQIP